MERPRPKYPTVGSTDAGSAADACRVGVKSRTYHVQYDACTVVNASRPRGKTALEGVAL